MITSSSFTPARMLLTASAAAAALIAFQPAKASACSCVPSPPPAEAAANATAVFEGRVTRIDDPQGEPKVRFQVVRTFKGPSSEAIEVRTANSSASCGYGFEEGQSYLVYASEAEGVLSTSLCTRTQRIADAAEDLAVLGLGVTPFDPGAGSDQPTPAATPATAEPKKGGCASCTIGAREHDAADGMRGMTALVLLVLGAAYRITSRRRSESRS